MTKYLIKVIPATVTVLAFAAMAIPVSAHVVVKPNKVTSGTSEIFSLQVPTEKDIPTTSVRLVIPEGVTNVTPYVKAGWKITEKKTGTGEDAVVTEIIWSEGEIPADLKDQFLFSAKVNAQSGDLIWKAYQTYSDNTVVAWEQDPSTIAAGEEGSPYSKTVVSAVIDTPTEATDEDSTMMLALILSIVGLTFSIAALYEASRKK